MARKREYRIEDAIQGAMQVFWQKGYAAASMSDIYDATGLKPGNLYATFTDKETLFQKAFEAYTAHFMASLPRQATGRAAILEWLDIQAGLAIDDPQRKGCLIVNTVAERHAHSAETLELADARLGEIRAFFAKHLEIAIDKREIAAHADVAALADTLTGTVVAIMSLGRAGTNAAMIRNVAKTGRLLLA